MPPRMTDIAGLRIAFVNVFFFGEPPGARSADQSWTLIDAGLPFSADTIVEAAAERYGHYAPPSAIILTHGHFDHVGALATLLERWPDVPVYAHPLELPYLTGECSYPPADPLVGGGGAMAWLSPLYPRRPIDIGERLQTLPADGSVPTMPGWRWAHVPGHTPGQVALFRDGDRTLISADAVITTKQESLLKVLAQAPEVRRPPGYFTPDWEAAGRSVAALEALRPLTVLTGHGPVMTGRSLSEGLRRLAGHFEEIGTPSHGRYARTPAVVDADGKVVSVPPLSAGDVIVRVSLVATLLAIGMHLVNSQRGRRRRW